MKAVVSAAACCACLIYYFYLYSGSKVCGEAWEWEQNHRENRQEKKIATNSPVIFRLSSSGPYKKEEGNGFKVHFNEFRPTGEY